MNRKNIITGILLLFILAAAFFVRIYRIDNVPSGIYSDEAENGKDLLQANKTGKYQLFYPGNGGREGLFINIQGMFVKMLGPSIFSLKFASIIFGTLTVLGVSLLSKEIFRSWRAGLISGYLVAFSYWAINFSRIGFRAIMVPFILSFSFYFLLKGFRTKKYRDFIFAGLIFGLGFHTYIAFRIAPFMIAALLVFMFIAQKGFIRNFWKQIIIFGIAAFLALSPMIYEFYTYPEYLSSRSDSVSIFSPQMNKGHVVQTFLRSFGFSLIKYNFVGEMNWRHNYPPYPILNPITGIAFLAGIIYVIVKTLHLLWLRYKVGLREEKSYLYPFLIAWFFLMLAPEFFTAEGLPHALRAIGTLPVVMIFATIPFLWILGKISHYGHISKISITSLFVGIFIFIAVFDLGKYFIFFANNPNQQKAFNKYLRDISDYFKTLPPSTEKILVSDEYTSLPVKFLNAETANTSYVWSGNIDYMIPKTKNYVIIIAQQPVEESYKKVIKKFPDLKTYEHTVPDGTRYIELKP